MFDSLFDSFLSNVLSNQTRENIFPFISFLFPMFQTKDCTTSFLLQETGGGKHSIRPKTCNMLKVSSLVVMEYGSNYCRRE